MILTIHARINESILKNEDKEGRSLNFPYSLGLNY